MNFAHLVENFAHRKVVGTEFHFQRCIGMTRLAGPLLVWALALGGGHANAQAGATPPPESKETAATHQPTADDACRTLEEAPDRDRRARYIGEWLKTEARYIGS